MSSHPDEGTIHAWLDDALEPHQATELEEHVRSCTACSATVAEARGLIASSSRILSALDDVPANVLPASRKDPSIRDIKARVNRSWWMRPQLAAAALFAVVAGSWYVASDASRAMPAAIEFTSDSAGPTMSATPGAPAISGAPAPFMSNERSQARDLATVSGQAEVADGASSDAAGALVRQRAGVGAVAGGSVLSGTSTSAQPRTVQPTLPPTAQSVAATSTARTSDAAGANAAAAPPPPVVAAADAAQTRDSSRAEKSSATASELQAANMATRKNVAAPANASTQMFNTAASPRAASVPLLIGCYSLNSSRQRSAADSISIPSRIQLSESPWTGSAEWYVAYSIVESTRDSVMWQPISATMFRLQLVRAGITRQVVAEITSAALPDEMIRAARRTCE